MLVNQLGFATIPFCQNIRRRCTAQNAGMNESGKLDARNMSGSTVNSLKVPDGLGAVSYSAQCQKHTLGACQVGMKSKITH